MKNNKHACDLKSCMLCKLCLNEWLPAIEANRKNYHVKKGELIFKEGEKVEGIFFVYEGTIKVHKQWGKDKELIVRFAKKGAIVGHRGFGQNIYYPVSGTAVEPATVCFISMDFFQSSLKVNHDFIFELLRFYGTELQESERNMRNLAHMSVRGRIANALLTLQSKFGITEDYSIDVVLSRQDLASFAGTTYETVFRILNEFTERKLVKVAGKQIFITDIENLKALTVDES